jgi:hypothetical protein
MSSHADRMIEAATAAGEWAEVRRWERIRARVDQAPPLAGALRDQLAVLLRPAPAIPRQRRRAEPRNAKAA